EILVKKSLCLALAMLICTAVYAQNETSAASSSFKMVLSQTSYPNNSVGVSVNATSSYKQVFAITSEQEAALNANYKVVIIDLNNEMDFQFSDDPKWQPGAKSVSIADVNNMSGAISKRTIKA